MTEHPATQPFPTTSRPFTAEGDPAVPAPDPVAPDPVAPDPVTGGTEAAAQTPTVVMPAVVMPAVAAPVVPPAPVHEPEPVFDPLSVFEPEPRQTEPAALYEPVPAPVPLEPYPSFEPDGAAGPGGRNRPSRGFGPDHGGEPVDVTVILPAYNEQDHVLAEVHRICVALDASEFSYELLAIDDASTDGTLAVLQNAQAHYPHLAVLPFRRNGGSGTARRIGTQLARGQVVAWTDADLTYPNERIPELVRFLRDDSSYDQIVGARTTEEGSHKILRVPAKWLIRKVAERLTNQRIPDLNSGLRAFRREVALPYLRLLPPGFSCVTTITLAFLQNQHDIRYVEIDYAKRAGTSKFHFVRDAYRYILQVLRMVMYFDPLKVLMPPALWLLVIGVGKGLFDMWQHPFYFPASTVLLVLTGLMIGSLALLSDLVVRSRDGV
jgi:polyisoprenyl-phosphate glycosyltransferase